MATLQYGNVPHEGAHVIDAGKYPGSFNGTMFEQSLKTSLYATEHNAYAVTAAIATESNSIIVVGGINGKGGHEFRPGAPQSATHAVIDAILRDPALHYNVTPKAQGEWLP
jgi:hypothetical protein